MRGTTDAARPAAGAPRRDAMAARLNLVASSHEAHTAADRHGAVFLAGLRRDGALAGLGWSFAFPAQYTSTAQVPVNIGQFAGDYPAASAYVQELVEAARDPQALSAVIVMQNLYRPSWSNQKLGPLVDRMRREIQIHSHTNLQNAAIDLSFHLSRPLQGAARTRPGDLLHCRYGAAAQSLGVNAMASASVVGVASCKPACEDQRARAGHAGASGL